MTTKPKVIYAAILGRTMRCEVLPAKENDVLRLGWDTESAGGLHRATQGGFSTPWCNSWQEVLEAIKGK